MFATSQAGSASPLTVDSFAFGVKLALIHAARVNGSDAASHLKCSVVTHSAALNGSTIQCLTPIDLTSDNQRPLPEVAQHISAALTKLKTGEKITVSGTTSQTVELVKTDSGIAIKLADQKAPQPIDCRDKLMAGLMNSFLAMVPKSANCG